MKNAVVGALLVPKKKRKKNEKSEGREMKKKKTISLTCRHFLGLTLSGSLVTRAIERTKRVRWTQLVGVTIFMANSRKNDQPNKLLAYAIKKKRLA